MLLKERLSIENNDRIVHPERWLVPIAHVSSYDIEHLFD